RADRSRAGRLPPARVRRRGRPPPPLPRPRPRPVRLPPVSDTTPSRAGAWAAGLATLAPDGRVLDTWYPSPTLAGSDEVDRVAATHGVDAPGAVRLAPEAAAAVLGVDVRGACGRDEMRGVDRVPVVTVIGRLDDPPVDAHDAYLRLHLLSHRLIRPHGANLDGLFGLLANVAWTSLGPCPADDVERVRLAARAAGAPLSVFGVDKFPRMTDYVVPSGVRIADADRVRLGA